MDSQRSHAWPCLLVGLLVWAQKGSVVIMFNRRSIMKVLGIAPALPIILHQDAVEAYEMRPGGTIVQPQSHTEHVNQDPFDAQTAVFDMTRECVNELRHLLSASTATFETLDTVAQSGDTILIDGEPYVLRHLVVTIRLRDPLSLSNEQGRKIETIGAVHALATGLLQRIQEKKRVVMMQLPAPLNGLGVLGAAYYDHDIGLRTVVACDVMSSTFLASFSILFAAA